MDPSGLLYGSKEQSGRWKSWFIILLRPRRTVLCFPLFKYCQQRDWRGRGGDQAFCFGLAPSISKSCDCWDPNGNAQQSIKLNSVILLAKLFVWCSSTSSAGLKGHSGRGFASLCIPRDDQVAWHVVKAMDMPTAVPSILNFFLQFHLYLQKSPSAWAKALFANLSANPKFI